MAQTHTQVQDSKTGGLPETLENAGLCVLALGMPLNVSLKHARY